MKKIYNEPEFKVVLTEKQDILTSSNESSGSGWMLPPTPFGG